MNAYTFISVWTLAKHFLTRACATLQIRSGVREWIDPHRGTFHMRWRGDGTLVYPGKWKRPGAAPEPEDIRLVAMTEPPDPDRAKRPRTQGVTRPFAGCPRAHPRPPPPPSIAVAPTLYDVDGHVVPSGDSDGDEPPDRRGVAPWPAPPSPPRIEYPDPIAPLPAPPGPPLDANRAPLAPLPAPLGLPLADARAIGALAGGGYVMYPIHSESGVDIGYILYNSRAESLDAHCACHRGGPLDCCLNRTRLPYHIYIYMYMCMWNSLYIYIYMCIYIAQDTSIHIYVLCAHISVV